MVQNPDLMVVPPTKASLASFLKKKILIDDLNYLGDDIMIPNFGKRKMAKQG